MDGQDASGRRMRKDVRRNLEQVLRAAHELIAERGADVTMEDVARRAGVGIGTIYRRFPSKEHLLAAVSQAACASTHICLREATHRAGDPVSKLRALVIVHYQHSERLAALLDLQAGSPANDQCPVAGVRQQLYDDLHAILTGIISEAQAQALMGPGEPALLAGLCMELLTPRALQHLQRLEPADCDTLANRVVQFLLHGLASS
ncbi:MAG TPA: TetR/AcrR family transcriptional regulator [Herpetosiphonaceae bacterium]